MPLTLDKSKAPLTALVLAVFPFASALADTAILVALQSEQSALTREVRIVGQPVEIAQHKVSIGYHKGEKLYIVRTGAGNLNSAMITQALLTRYRVDRVISIGVAGNLNDEWKIGDLLVVSHVLSHQEGKETPGGFEAKQGQPSAISHQRSAEYLKKCEVLRSNAVEVAKVIATGMSLPQENEKLKAESRKFTPIPKSGLTATTHQGRLVSGESFIASTAKRKWLRETFHADAVDMVSVGIARVCEANGVPYVIIRVLSDNADESASAAFAGFVQNYPERDSGQAAEKDSGQVKGPVTASIALALIERVTAGSSAPPH
jgi:nucleoside phosphorylase